MLPEFLDSIQGISDNFLAHGNIAAQRDDLLDSAVFDVVVVSIHETSLIPLIALYAGMV